MTTIALRLDPDTRHKLELLAKATGYSRSALVHEAVRRFVDAELNGLLALQAQIAETGTSGGQAGAVPAAAGKQGTGESESASLPPPERWKIIV